MRQRTAFLLSVMTWACSAKDPTVEVHVVGTPTQGTYSCLANEPKLSTSAAISTKATLGRTP